jgi:hypothetical protein
MKEEKKESLERLTFICECHSLDHQVSFWYDEEYDQLYCEPHLVSSNNVFKRCWIGIRYIFGYKSRYGEWDSTIFKTKDMVALRQFLEEKY